MADHVSGRPGLQEPGAISDRKSVATTILSSVEREERSRHKHCAFAERQRISKNKIERKVDSAVRGEMMAQRKLYEAEPKVEARIQLLQASRWANQAQRETRSVCTGELELRNGLFQDNHARDCQEIEELRRICCEEANRARQARSDELSVKGMYPAPHIHEHLATAY